ncbi:TetR/AcrR family transcriptional regulator [Paenibacillus sp. N1-5-1-14]|uniref:TetR/AcrR family transcriptional regulator n=1 Tax=Paenibacillus radicibacter TaxID=2972488 RepID=UPI0021591C4E|nr:TetR/AcrR family transcriptional regulator [Paenibacillus radicibacter]MCR8642633.1 TetR/AcrR family transcriptional regulator [Paenibacillus radicibacter]
MKVTATRIKEIALKHFAKDGYEGASLANIADEVGIKKPSIYAHFKGKEDLFLHIIRDVFTAELQIVDQYMTTHQASTLHDVLYGLLASAKDRYEQDEQMKFMLRMSFFPPQSVAEQVNTQTYMYLDGIEERLIHRIRLALTQGDIPPIDAGKAAAAYLCIIDGTWVELLFGGPERFTKRLDAAWHIYWLGLTHKQG